MEFSFFKYHGAGNDFILIDGRTLGQAIPGESIATLCHRRFGIGADGLIIITPSDAEGVDYDMLYFNADGNVSSMCGNGARCAYLFARVVGLAPEKSVFSAYDGLHEAEMTNDELVRISMCDVDEITHPSADVAILNTGSPHYIEFVESLDHLDAFARGREIRNRPAFVKEGINVNFVRVNPDGTLRIRTYERGVEDLTLACGTGVTAAALAYADKEGLATGVIPVTADGGSLTVSFEAQNGRFTKVYLTGPVVKVFEGIWKLKR